MSELRDEIADAMSTVEFGGRPYVYDQSITCHLADAILPIVERVRAEARREALEEAVTKLRQSAAEMQAFSTGNYAHDQAFDNGYLSALGTMKRFVREAKP